MSEAKKDAVPVVDLEGYGSQPAFPGEQGSTSEGLWNQTWDPGMTYKELLVACALIGVAGQAEHYTPNEVGDAAVKMAESTLLAIRRATRRSAHDS